MVTIKDIAKKVGVNISTVSRALNNSKNISEEKKKEIWKAADELGYIPNESAAVLAGKNARTVGILLPEISSNYYARMAAAIESNLKENGFSTVIGQSLFKAENELDYIKLFLKKNVDGIIAAFPTNEAIGEEIKKLPGMKEIPLIYIESFADMPEYDNIEIDNEHGIKLAVDYLARQGHKRIGFISEYLSAKVRLPAFIGAMQKCGRTVDGSLIKIGNERFEEGGYLRMKELLNQGNPPSAVFASYDNLALGAMKAVAETGLRIPEDISVIGFDNIRESDYFPVPLTTVSPPLTELGELSIGILLDKINDKQGKEVQHISLKPQLVIRKSAAAVKDL